MPAHCGRWEAAATLWKCVGCSGSWCSSVAQRGAAGTRATRVLSPPTRGHSTVLAVPYAQRGSTASVQSMVTRPVWSPRSSSLTTRPRYFGAKTLSTPTRVTWRACASRRSRRMVLGRRLKRSSPRATTLLRRRWPRCLESRSSPGPRDHFRRQAFMLRYARPTGNGWRPRR